MYATLLCVLLGPVAATPQEIAESPVTVYRPRCGVHYEARYWASTMQSRQSGYDYRRQFDYPWSMRPIPIAAIWAARPLPAMDEGASLPNPQKPSTSPPSAPASSSVPPLR
jgi:hypothetical protein